MNIFKQPHEQVFLFAALLLLPLFLFNAPGTHDVMMWAGWANSIVQYGLIEGYTQSNSFYPPLMFVNLWALMELEKLPFLPSTYLFKLSLLLCILITCWQTWRWTKNIIMVLALYFSLVFSCIYMAYMDAWIAPFLVGGLYALIQRRYISFSVLYCIACLIKWQPIILAPVIGIYLLGVGQENHFDRKAWGKMALHCFGPAILITVSLLAPFGFGVVINKFADALNDGFLSAQALNLAWIITYGLHVYLPDIYGPLQHSSHDLIMDSPKWAIVFLKILFFIILFTTLAIFLKRKKTTDNFLIGLFSVYFAYYILNTGVHENHLFIGVLLVSIIAGRNEKYLPLMIIIHLMNIINMLMFYPFYEDPLQLGLLVMNIDISLVVSIFNVLFFTFFWAHSQLINPDNSAPA